MVNMATQDTEAHQDMYKLASGNSKLPIVRPCEAIEDRWLEIQLNVRQHPRTRLS